MARYLVTLYGEVKVEAKDAKAAIKVAQKRKAANWRTYRYQCEERPEIPLSILDRMKNWFRYTFVLPFRALRGVITVGRVMEERLANEHAKRDSDPNWNKLIESKAQFDLDRLADENSYLKNLVGQAMEQGCKFTLPEDLI